VADTLSGYGETGKVSTAREALLRLRLTAGESSASINTGFTGALVLPQSLIAQLHLPIVGRDVFEMASGQRFVVAVALAEVEWLGVTETVRVIVSEDTLPGTEMLDGTRLTVDYVGDIR
jgi:clan AA aspartic protease